MFVAAVIPGLILSGAFILLILAMATWKPQWIGEAATDAVEADAESVLSAFMKIFPILLLVFLVIGGIYDGWFTPTEAGAAGAFGALVIGLFKRKLNWKVLWGVLI